MWNHPRPGTDPTVPCRQGDSQSQDCQGSPCDDPCYSLWDPEGDFLLRFTQPGARTRQKEGREERRGPGKTLRGKRKAAGWREQRHPPHQSPKAGLVQRLPPPRGGRPVPSGLEAPGGSSWATLPFLPGGDFWATWSGQRVSSTRTAPGPGKGQLRALLKARRREQVTGGAGSILVREAEPSERVQAWPPTRGEAREATLPSLGLRVPTGKNTDWCFSSGFPIPLAGSSNKTVSGCPTQETDLKAAFSGWEGLPGHRRSAQPPS